MADSPDPTQSEGSFFHAVMQILEANLHNAAPKTPSISPPTDNLSSGFDIRQVLRRPCSSAKAVAHWSDEDWKRIAQLRDKSSSPATLVRVYDKKKGCIFHVQQPSLPPMLRPTDPDRHASAGTSMSSTPAPAPDPTTLDLDLNPAMHPEVQACLDRLVPEIHHFAPLLYEHWMAAKLYARQDALRGLDQPFRKYGSLCECCRTVVTHSAILYSQVAELRAFVRREVFGHHASVGRLRMSAWAGCHLCMLLVSSLGCRDAQGGGEVLDGPCLVTVTWRGRLGVHVRGQRLRTEVPTYIPAIPFEEVEPTIALPHTNSQEVGNLVRRWLTDCLSVHIECLSQPCMLASFLPTRLVRVAASGGAVTSAKLVNGINLPMGTRYLTLSHCWGDGKFVALAKGTLQNFQCDIPLSRLTKTFRDALQVTVWLGYEYIWIDALCILQDSDEDWRAECASMGSIYRHSTCTIAALGARDGNDGLFCNRYAPAVTPCPLLQDGSRKMYAMDPQRYREPLLERAWVLQEQCLSARTLRFGMNCVSWICKTRKRAEIPQDIDQWRSPKNPLALFTRLTSQIFQPFTPLSGADKDWEVLLGYFTARRLRILKDKSAAFQGLSSEIAKARGWHMIHGLWTHNWTKQLLWFSHRPRTDKRMLESGAPSWSWLTVSDHTYLNIGSCEVRDADIALHPDSDRVLSISARMERFSVLTALLQQTAERSQRDVHAVQLNWYGRTLWHPDAAEDVDGDAWGIQLTKFESDSGPLSRTFVSCGLVVVPVDARQQSWRRVGAYRFRIHLEGKVYAADDVVSFPLVLRPWFNGEKREVELI